MSVSAPFSVRSGRALLGLVSLCGCTRAEAPPAPPATATQAPLRPSAPERTAPPAAVAEPDAAPAPPQAPPLPPPLAGEEMVTLEVPGFQPAVVSVPLGTRGPRPVAVALHGNFDRPEWQCGVWRPIVKSRGFVLCPRGVPRQDVPRSMDRWEYTSQKNFDREIEAGVAALSARFNERVAPGPLLFIGFSLGAIFGARLVQGSPERFPRVVFIEGGLATWTAATAKRFVAKGGQRLLLACGQWDCMTRGKLLLPALERAGLPTRHGGQRSAGHTYDGPVAAFVADNWDWLVEGDARWLAEGAAPNAGSEAKSTGE